ncbi:MAG: 2-iminobutanoate/2-iminopropanoate deaminase [Gammaproteobacteria bacterium]|jgi:2-iminobutanoate/2-iminopropanoate deaminase
MPKKKLLNPDWPRSAKADFAQGVQVGDTIYVSGQVAQGPDGKLVGEGDMKAQAEQVFANIEGVLAVGGATLKDIVRITTYVTDMSQYGHYARVRKALFPNANIASATVASPMLVSDGFLIEIEATAVVGAGA